MEISPENKEKIMEMVRECSDSLLRISSERELIKNTVKDLSKKIDIPVKTLKKMIKVYYQQNFDQEVAEQEEFEELYETVLK
jgi:uncharacterized membrane protein YjjP (DUF1212 family)